MEQQKSKLDRLRSQLREAEAQLTLSQFKSMVIPPAALMAKITRLRQAVAEAEAYEPRRLSELIDRKVLSEYKLADKIIKLHIAADYLDDCACELKSALGKLGLQGCSLFPMVNDIEKIASKFAGIVCHPDFAGLSDFMTTNERLIDDLHLIVDRYLKQRLKITNE